MKTLKKLWKKALSCCVRIDNETGFINEGLLNMNKSGKIIIVVILVVSVVLVIALKHGSSHPNTESMPVRSPAVKTTIQQSPALVEPNAVEPRPQPAKTLPRLVDLGADKCIPCKMMAPILEELKKEYAGRFQVDFFDVWKNPDIANEYGIRIIPTQIFFDASGKERFRHEGFFSKEDILAKWKELGVELTKTK